MSALLLGQGVAEVARTYRVPISTVSLWKKDAWARPGQSADIGDLLLGFVRETLGTLTVQVIAYRDMRWLRKQRASDAAVLTGVLADRSAGFWKPWSPESKTIAPGVPESGSPYQWRRTDES